MQAELIEWMTQTAQEIGPWDFATVVGILHANHICAQSLCETLKALRPYIA